MNRPYRQALPGPAVEEAFTVQAGLLVVAGLGRATVRVPAGGCWPGLGALPDWMLGVLQPTESWKTADAHTTPLVGSCELASGVALVHAQLLMSGYLEGRLRLLGHTVSPDDLNQVVVGHFIGTTRETVNLLLRGRSKRRQEARDG